MSPPGRHWLLLGSVIAYVLLAAFIPPFDDELYYWCWSKELRLSYYDHPGMVAYMIRASTAVFGDGLFAIRLPAVLTAVVVTAVLDSMCRPSRLLLPILLLPVSSFGMVVITPDTPFLLFGALYLRWLMGVHERLADGQVGWSRWVAGGLILGGGLLGKYTTGLMAAAGGVSFLFAGPGRRWAGGYLLHAAVAAAVASPIVVHNAARDFAPMRFQWSHAITEPAGGLLSLTEFVGGQALLFGAVPLVVFVWAVRHRAELWADPRRRVWWCLFVLPFAFFLVKASMGRVQANWAWGCYLAGWPLACEWYRRVGESAGWRAFTRFGFAVPVGVTAVMTAHLIEPVPLVPPNRDRAVAQIEKNRIAQAVATDLRARGYSGPVFVDTYQWTALLRWHGVDALQVPGRTRPSEFTEHQGLTEGGELGPGLEFVEWPYPPTGADRSGYVAGYELLVRGHSRAWFGVRDRSGPRRCGSPD